MIAPSPNSVNRIARNRNGDRMSAIAGLELALHDAEAAVKAAIREKRKLPTLLAVAEYNRDRVLNKNKPQIRKLKSDSERYRSLMSGVFVIDNNDDEAYDKYISFREQADEADRLCAILEAEVRKARALVEKRNQAIASADQAIANAKTHRDCIKATLEEAILEMANVPIEYHHLVRIIDGRHGHKSVCIAREDIPGACLLLGVSDGRLTNVSAFAEQINLLRCRDEQNEMLAAD